MNIFYIVLFLIIYNKKCIKSASVTKMYEEDVDLNSNSSNSSNAESIMMLANRNGWNFFDHFDSNFILILICKK